MKDIFKNKKILFLGDSNFHHGYGVYNLRSYFSRSEEKCFVFNKGLGGNRASMVKYLFEEEVLGGKPDIVFFSYGVNDMAIWLYDSQKQVTAELLQKRQARDEEHLTAMKDTAFALKANGITPVICSQFGLDEFIVEKEDISTLADNKEKEDYIGLGFYKRATMRAINQKIAFYRNELKKFALDNGFLFLDFFEVFQKVNGQNAGLFRADGLHLTVDKGHTLMAKTVLEFMGCDNIPVEFAKDSQNDAIFEYEQFERSIQYLKYAVLSPYLGYDTKEKFLAGLEEQKARTQANIQTAVSNYLSCNGNVRKIEIELDKITREYIGANLK